MVEAGLRAPLALPVVIAARKALALRRFNASAAERTLAASSSAEMSTFWECIAANTGTPACCPLADVAFLQTVLQDLDNDEHLNRALVSVPKTALLGPLTGMSVAMLAMQGKQSSTSLRAYALMGVMVRARLRHAEIVGVHPLRLLTFFSMREAGLANDPTLVFLSTDERLIDGDDQCLVNATE